MSSLGYKNVFGLPHLAKYYDCAIFVVTDERNFAHAEMLQLPSIGRMWHRRPSVGMDCELG